MSYNFWAWAQGTMDLDEEEKEQSKIEAEKRAKVIIGDATTEGQVNGVTTAQTTDRVSANWVDYDEEEKEQAMSEAKKIASAHTEDATTKSSTEDQDDQVGDDSRQGGDVHDIHEFCSRLLPASTSTTTFSITVYETLTAATTIFVKPTTMPITNTVATTTVTAAGSPTLETISLLDPDVGSGVHEHAATISIPVTAMHEAMTKGPTTSPANHAVGIHIPRGTVAATLFLMCVWVVVSGGIWVRGTHFHRAMLLVVPAMFPPIFVGCFMQDIIAMNYPLLPELFVRALLFLLGVCACLMFLEAFGVFAFVRQAWDAFMAWKSGQGWHFSWGWTRDKNARGTGMEWVEYTERTERRRGRREGRYVPAPW